MLMDPEELEALTYRHMPERFTSKRRSEACSRPTMSREESAWWPSPTPEA
jgi:hypothetical protein